MFRFQFRCPVHYRDWWKWEVLPPVPMGNLALPTDRFKCAKHLRRKPMIWVDLYYRVRDGVIQHVRGHWRRKPGYGKSATVIPFRNPTAA
jgi:hypothetical protein